MDMKKANRFIYIACPWTHVGGGMFKVADYLVQMQHTSVEDADAVELRPLDTRGPGSAAKSVLITFVALAKIVFQAATGRLVGVHINMAERLSFVRKSMVILVCRASGVPVVLHLHAAQLHHFYRGLPSLFKYAVRWIFRQPSKIIVLGNTARAFVETELNIPRDKISVVNNGVPKNSNVLKADERATSYNLLFLGSDWDRKGLYDLFYALKDERLMDLDTHLVVAGRGDQTTAMRRASELGILSKVSFTGWLSQEEASRHLASATVLVLPSYDEGLPLVILEALGAGIPVVCTPVGEIPTVLSDKHVCYVTPGDPASIAGGIFKVLENSEYTDSLTRCGQAIYEDMFSLDSFFDQICRIHLDAFGFCAKKINQKL